MKRVIAAAIFEGDSVLLCRKATLNYYIFPGGKPEEGESDPEALEREIKEELASKVDTSYFMNTFFGEAPDGEKIEVDLWGVTLDSDPVASSEIVELVWFNPLFSNINTNYPLTAMSKQLIEYLYNGKARL